MWLRTWLRHRFTRRKVAALIPDGVMGIFHWHSPSVHTMVLELTQPPTEMSTRNVSWGLKVAGVYGWQSYHLHVPTVLKSVSLNLLDPSGPVQACNRIALRYTHVMDVFSWIQVVALYILLCSHFLFTCSFQFCSLYHVGIKFTSYWSWRIQ